MEFHSDIGLNRLVLVLHFNIDESFFVYNHKTGISSSNACTLLTPFVFKFILTAFFRDNVFTGHIRNSARKLIMIFDFCFLSKDTLKTPLKITFESLRMYSKFDLDSSAMKRNMHYIPNYIVMYTLLKKNARSHIRTSKTAGVNEGSYLAIATPFECLRQSELN